jgi:hypothetical protein
LFVSEIAVLGRLGLISSVTSFHGLQSAIVDKHFLSTETILSGVWLQG